MSHIRIDSHLCASQSSIQSKRAVQLTKMAEHACFDLEPLPSILGACEAMKAMKAMKASAVIFLPLPHSRGAGL